MDAQKKIKNLYRCPHCGKIVKRDSNKQWLKSWCDKIGRDARLQKIKLKEELK